MTPSLESLGTQLGPDLSKLDFDSNAQVLVTWTKTLDLDTRLVLPLWFGLSVPTQSKLDSDCNHCFVDVDLK